MAEHTDDDGVEMNDQPYGRILQVVPSPDPTNLRVRLLDPSLAPVMGRFAAAVYVHKAHAYDVPQALAGQFATFARVHNLLVLELPTAPDPYAPSHETARVLAEAAARRGTAAQDETNRKGSALVRLAADLAARARARRGAV